MTKNPRNDYAKEQSQLEAAKEAIETAKKVCAAGLATKDGALKERCLTEIEALCQEILDNGKSE